MGNCLSKIPEGYLERFTRFYQSGKHHRIIPSFQEWQALIGRTDINMRVITTPISDRFPACACDLEYKTPANKFVYENVKKEK